MDDYSGVERRRPVLHDHQANVQRSLRILVVATCLLFLLSAGIGLYAYFANHNRINDIQQGRISSCQRTYQAFIEVFKPVEPPPSKRTPEENARVHQFNRTIRRLQRNCSHQIAGKTKTEEVK